MNSICSLDPAWFEKFFSGSALELWRRAIPIETTQAELAFLNEALAAPKAGLILDLPCGNGRLSIPLSLMGYKVTGIDLCDEFLAEAKKTAAGYKTKIDFVKTDMRIFSLKKKFDAAFCLGNSFGYFDTEGTKQFLSSVCKSLKSGGRFVIDSSMLAESFLVNGGDREWVRFGDMYMLIENRYDCRSSCVETSYTFIQNGKEEIRKAVHWIYTLGELCRLLEQSGFAIVDTLSSTDFEAFELGSSRLLLIAKKP